MKNFPFHINIWKNSKRVYRLGLYERGLYLELIILAFKHDNKIKVDLDGWVELFNTELIKLKRTLNGLYKMKLIKGDDSVISVPSVQKHLDKIDREDKTDYDIIKRTFHNMCPSLPKIKSLSKSRKSHIKARLKEHGESDIFSMFRIAEASNFLSGRETDWRANFDWLMNPTNFSKVIEGNFQNKGEKDVLEVQEGAPEGYEHFSIMIGNKKIIPDSWRDGLPHAKDFLVNMELNKKFLNEKL